MARRRVLGVPGRTARERRSRVLGWGRANPGGGVIIEPNDPWPDEWGFPAWGFIDTTAWEPPRVADRDAPWGIPMLVRPQHPVDIPLTTLNRDYVG